MQISSSIALHKKAIQIHSISCGLFSGPAFDLISSKMDEMAKIELERMPSLTESPIRKCGKQMRLLLNVNGKKVLAFHKKGWFQQPIA